MPIGADSRESRSPAVVSIRGFRAVYALAFVLAGAAGWGCGSETSTSTAPSTLPRCAVSLQTSNGTVPAAGGSGRILVTTERECAWSAESEVPWLTIAGASTGQGNGSIEYRVAANNDPATRRGAILLNDRRAEITQAAAPCLIRLEESSAEFAPSGGSGTVEVDATSSMCTWTASADVPWITFTSAVNGKGAGSVSFAVAGTTGPPRTGTIRVADQQFSVIQSEGCTYSIAPAGESVSPGGQTGTIEVATASGCPWTALSNVPWITISGGSTQTGPGTVSYSVAPTEGPSRTGTLVVAGQTFTITQDAGCSFAVAPLAHSIGAAGGTVNVTVEAAAGCDWSASTSAPWISIAGAATGTGSGTVSLVIAASAGAARSGTATVAGHTVTISQAQGCSYAIAPESQSVPAAGGSGSVTVTAAGGCSWTAESNEEWITVTRGASGTGNGTVEFSVAATTGPARAGTITIAGRTFTVNQGEGCQATLVPDEAGVPASGGTSSFEVRTGSGCTWTARANVPWITIASGESGTGTGTVQLEVAANAGAPRTGTVTAAGATFTVQQQSGCSVALSGSGQEFPAAGGTGDVGVTAGGGCEWTAATEADWITITAGSSGSGDGRVAFGVETNPGPGRTAPIVIGGQTFTVTQGGACTFAIAPDAQAVPAAGAEVDVAVTSSVGCQWTAVSNAPWIEVVSGASGAGNGQVELGVEASTSPARTGTVTIAGHTFTVTQESGCTYTVAPTSRSAPVDGGPDMFNVSTSSADCPWTAVSTVPWITIVGEPAGTGNGKVDYMVEPNPGAARTGTITLQGQVFTVTQAGG